MNESLAKASQENFFETYDVLVDDSETENHDLEHQQDDDADAVLEEMRKNGN